MSEGRALSSDVPEGLPPGGCAPALPPAGEVAPDAPVLPPADQIAAESPASKPPAEHTAESPASKPPAEHTAESPASDPPAPDASGRADAGPQLRVDSLGDSVLILLAMTAVQRVVGFVRAVFFCRWMDADQLGRWDMAFSFLMLAAPLSVLSLSGAFGRYVEHYRQRGQLRSLVSRIAWGCAMLGLPAVAVLVPARPWFSRLVFGSAEHTGLTALMALCLLAVIATHYFLDLFNALRNVRLIAGLQLLNGLLFTALALGMLGFWQCTAGSVVAAYGLACTVCAVVGFRQVRRLWRTLPPDSRLLPQKELWSRVLPYVGWMMLVGLLVNLFEIADRYMIVHFSGMSSQEALACVGQYHSSRVVPLLLVSITLMLGTMITPHLSHDWEAGRRHRVVARLNLFLKLWGCVLVSAGLAVLLAAPLLFGVAFRGKFADGRAVLPWTITYCTWAALAGVVHIYLLCAEKAGRSVPATGIGLAVNVGLNLLLLPWLGLLGAVLATTAANLVALTLICVFCRRLGMRFDTGSLLVLGLPLVLCLGPLVAMLVLAAVAAAALRWDVLLSKCEKRRLAASYHDYRRRVAAWLRAS